MNIINKNHSSLALLFLLFFGVASVTTAGPTGHAPWVGEAFDGIPCKGQNENFGPFDYLQRASLSSELRIVERYHFNANVEQLIAGQSNTTGPLPDLDYTLRAWPNHHRALNSAVRYRISELNSKRTRSRRLPTAECYLQRAINFSPKDGTAIMLYAMFSQRANDKPKALQLYRESLKIDANNLQTQYNLGLLLTDMGKFEEANSYAQKVYSSGYPLPGLKQKLVKSGHWKETSNDDISSGVSEVQ